MTTLGGIRDNDECAGEHVARGATGRFTRSPDCEEGV
jgi:hypothetical protein